MSKFQTVCLIQTGVAEEVSSRIYESFPISIGRSSETAIGIADPGISRMHAELRLKKGQIWVVDMGSANGTFVNGERIEAQTPVLCNPDDLIELGTHRVPLRLQVFEKAFERKQIADANISSEEKNRILGLLDAAHAEIKRIGEVFQANQAQAQTLTEEKIANQLREAQEKADEIIRSAQLDGENIRQVARAQHDSVVGAAAGDAQATVDQMIREATEQSEMIANSIIDQGEAKLAAITEARRQEFETMMNEGRAQLAELRRQDEERAEQAALIAAEEIEARRTEILRVAEEKATATLGAAVAEFERVKSQTEAIYQAEVDRGMRVVAEHKLRTEEEMSARVEQSQVMLKNAVEKSAELIGNAERTSKAQLEDAEMKSTAMLKVSREDSTRLLEKTQKEILEQFSVHQNDMQRLRQDTERDLEETTANLKSLKEAVETLTSELTDVDEKLASAREALQRTTASLTAKESEEVAIDKKRAAVERQVGDLEVRREKLSAEFAELQKRHGDVAAVINSKQEEWDAKQARLEAEFAQQQAKTRDEVAAYREREMGIVDKLKLEELEALAVTRSEEAAKIDNHRAEVVSELLKVTEGHFLAKLRPVLPSSFDWRTVSDPLHAEIKDELERLVYDISRRERAPVEEVQLTANQQRLLKRTKQTGLAVGLALVLLLLIPGTRGILLDAVGLGSGASAADKYAHEMQVERERRWQPEKTRAWKESYTDSVLFTEGYVQMKLDSQSQEKWIRELHSYLYGKLRVDEDSIIKIVSLEAALIANLNEQAGQIHPDYVAEKTARMRETEAEALVEIKKLLGKERNVEKFQKFSQDYYYNEYLLRLPANETSESPPESP